MIYSAVGLLAHISHACIKTGRALSSAPVCEVWLESQSGQKVPVVGCAQQKLRVAHRQPLHVV